MNAGLSAPTLAPRQRATDQLAIVLENDIARHVVGAVVLTVEISDGGGETVRFLNLPAEAVPETAIASDGAAEANISL